MAHGHKNRHQQSPHSQRPAQQQVSTHPVGDGSPHDNMRVPSPATTEQSQQDALAADPDRYEPVDGAITDTDAQPNQVTDLAGGDDTTDDELTDDELDNVIKAEDAEVRTDEESADAFTDFDDPAPPELRGHHAPTEIRLSEVEQHKRDHKLVPVTPRRTVMRTKIGDKWWNFVKGQEQFVPQFVADHIAEKGVI